MPNTKKLKNWKQVVKISPNVNPDMEEQQEVENDDQEVESAKQEGVVPKSSEGNQRNGRKGAAEDEPRG